MPGWDYYYPCFWITNEGESVPFYVETTKWLYRLIALTPTKFCPLIISKFLELGNVFTSRCHEFYKTVCWNLLFGRFKSGEEDWLFDSCWAWEDKDTVFHVSAYASHPSPCSHRSSLCECASTNVRKFRADLCTFNNNGISSSKNRCAVEIMKKIPLSSFIFHPSFLFDSSWDNDIYTKLLSIHFS